MKYTSITSLVILLLGAKLAWSSEATFSGEKALFAERFDLYNNEGDIVVVPKEIAKGKPWVWRARFGDTSLNLI